MLPKILNFHRNFKGASRLYILVLGVIATLSNVTPAKAQSSTIIYQRTTTYDSYQPPTVTNFIYGSPIPTPVPVNPYTGAIINSNIDSSSSSLYPQVRVYRQNRVYRHPRVHQHINNSTLVNPVLVNPRIRNSTIIHPTIINK